MVVVATDIGISKKSRDMAARLKAPLAIVEKRRVGNNDQTETLNIIGEVAGKTAITFDDEIDTAGSLVHAVDALLKEGAKEVYACASHPVFSGPAIQRLAASPVKEIIVTDTIPVPPANTWTKSPCCPSPPCWEKPSTASTPGLRWAPCTKTTNSPIIREAESQRSNLYTALPRESERRRESQEASLSEV